MKPIDICKNQELINDINEVFAKHGLRLFDTYISIDSSISFNLSVQILGHKIYIESYLLNILDLEEDERKRQ